MSRYSLQRKRYEYINFNEPIKKNTILFNPSELSYDLIKNYNLTEFNNNAPNVALLVESRIFYNTEFILRQFSRFLPNDFAMWIYVTSNIYNDYLRIVNILNNNINLKILPDEYKLASNKDYNNLMLNINFWNLFIQFERVLIFQSDSMMYHSGIEQYYQYDFIGSPFKPEYKIITNVGNGSMSLRNINAMIYCLRNKSKVRILRYKTYLDNIKKYNNNHAEYIFYVYAMNQFKYNIANIETASLFAIKNYMYNDNCMFSYKLYTYNDELYTKLLLKSIGLTYDDVTLYNKNIVDSSSTFISQVEPQPTMHVEPEPIIYIEQQPMMHVEPQPMMHVEPQSMVQIESQPIMHVESETIIYVEPQPMMEVKLEDVQQINQHNVNYINLKYVGRRRYISKNNKLLQNTQLLLENNIPVLKKEYKFLDSQLIERYPLSKFNNSSKNIALMLESRIFENSEFILRQFSRYLPEDFALWIYVTDDVYNSYVDLANKLNNNINIVQLPSQYILNSVNDYNNIMLNISFWTMLQQFERVLIFQMDTMIYRKGIELYYEYDYIGAPWNPNSYIATSVGNGGLSLRNIQAMIYCLQNRESVQTGNFNNNNIAEDVFFSYAMNQFGYKVANVETALSFSIESYGYTENSLGSHKLYDYNYELYDKLLQRSIFGNTTINILIATVGRSTLQRMLNSLVYQLNENDCLTIVYDGHKFIPYFNISNFKCKVLQYFEPEALKYWGHGIRNKYATLLEKTDFVMHADDDDIYLPSALNTIRNNIIDWNTLYIYKLFVNNLPHPIIHEIKVGNIGTPCGIIPYNLNLRGVWGYIYGGDGMFYETLLSYEKNIKFFNDVIYSVRPYNILSNYNIGIYGIFIGLYINYLDDFLLSIEKYFFPGITKKYFIVTDQEVIEKPNIYIIKIDSNFISWPCPTLFRFKYFKQIPLSELNNINYMFFLNSNARIKQRIDMTNIPIDRYNCIFTQHNGFVDQSYNSITFEKNNVSTSYIPYIDNYKYTYIGGGFYGATIQYFIKLNDINYDNINIDLKNNFIACWHDESHLNYFYFKNNNNIYLLDITYHVPECRINDFTNIFILYLDKRKNNAIVNYKDKIEGRCTVEINKSLIDYYDKIKIGNIIVTNIYDVLADIKNIYEVNANLNTIKNGYSFLLRIKNEQDTIERCVLDIVDLADEIIIVDNNSTDNTLRIILDLEKKYSNIFVYQYRINIPRVGREHAESLNKDNTLKNYYNWTLSKATYNKKIKWDGDFYVIRENLLEMLNEYRNMNDLMAVWFSGLTLFIHNSHSYYKNYSYYDEYRMFYNSNHKIWSDSFNNNNQNICESSINFVNSVSNKYKYEKPIYIEIKNTNKDEFTGRSTILQDDRDNIDYDILYELTNNTIHKLLIKTNNIYEDHKLFELNNELKFVIP